MITERTLRKWRAQALELKINFYAVPNINHFIGKQIGLELCERILRLTQELLDQHLLRKEKKRND